MLPPRPLIPQLRTFPHAASHLMAAKERGLLGSKPVEDAKHAPGTGLHLYCLVLTSNLRAPA